MLISREILILVLFSEFINQRVECQSGIGEFSNIFLQKKNLANPYSGTEQRYLKDVVSSEGVLVNIASKYLKSCSLTIFYETTTSDLALNLRQSLSHWGTKMYLLTRDTLMSLDTWNRTVCDGYFFLLATGEELIQHATIDHFKTIPYRVDYLPPSLWNYKAHYIILLPSSGTLRPNDLLGLYNFKKTEKVVILQNHGDTVKIWTHILIAKVVGFEVIDSWSKGRFQKGRNIFPSKFSDFQGNILRVATFELAPFVIFRRDSSGEILDRIGVDMQVIEGLAKAMNFTVDYIEVSDDEKWGNKLPDGSWTGLMGEVYSETSAMSVCNVFIDGPRWGLIDYSAPYNYMPACFVAPAPKPLPHWKSPTLPFAWSTWLSIGFSLLIGGILLYLVSGMSIKSESTEFRSLTYSYLYILGSLTSRSVGPMPRYMPSRIYAGFVWISCLIISTAYSANLIAFLSVTQMEPPIQTLEQLVKSGLRIGGNSIWKSLFEMATQQAILDLVPKMELDVNYEEVFYQVEDGEFAFIQNRQFLELTRDARFTYGGRATVRIVEECFMNYNVALTLPRNSPLTDNLARDLIRMFESGMLSKWKEEVVKYFTLRYSEERAKAAVISSRSNPLNLSHVQGIFFILGFGYLLAVVTLAVENVFRSKGNGMQE